jgi:CheY-like chemotaxis protein
MKLAEDLGSKDRFMRGKVKILQLEANVEHAALAAKELQKADFESEITVAFSKIEFIVALQEFEPDIVISDDLVPDFNAFAALDYIKTHSSNIPFILLTNASEEYALAVAAQGAFDYIQKDRMARLPLAVANAVFNNDGHARVLKRQIAFFQKLIENSFEMKTLADENGVLLYGSPSITRILGYQPKDFIGKNVNDFIHPDDILNLSETTNNMLLQPEKPFQVQQRIRH